MVLCHSDRGDEKSESEDTREHQGARSGHGSLFIWRCSIAGHLRAGTWIEPIEDVMHSYDLLGRVDWRSALRGRERVESRDSARLYRTTW